MVIVGGGFAGLFAARMLARAPVQSLANLTKHNIGQLTALVKTRLRRMQYRAGLSTASWPRPNST